MAAELRIYRSAGEREFKDWMNKVDASVGAKVGLSVYDLPDCAFRDWFEDGVRAGAAARSAIRAAS